MFKSKVTDDKVIREPAPPREHNKVLALLYMSYGLAHAAVLIAASLLLLFFKGRISNFSDMNLRLLGILALAALSSLIAGWGAGTLRRGSGLALAVASIVVLAVAGYFACFLLLNTHVTLLRLLVAAAYALPSIAISLYSMWFVLRDKYPTRTRRTG